MSLCPCGGREEYMNCCGRYIEGNEWAPTPEKLMRSRYTAYTLANIDYIQKTMVGPGVQEFNDNEAKQWAKAASWQGLKVLSASPYSLTNDATVSFVASYRLYGKREKIEENSRFVLQSGKWFYELK